MPIVQRQDGSTAYIESDDDAKMYAESVGGTVHPDDDNPDDKTPESVPSAPDTADTPDGGGDDDSHV